MVRISVALKSINAVQSKKFNQVKRGIFIQGSELCITLDESKFSCQADVYHFATMLHQFFVMYAPINQSIQTRIECIPSYKEFVWTDRAWDKARTYLGKVVLDESGNLYGTAQLEQAL